MKSITGTITVLTATFGLLTATGVFAESPTPPRQEVQNSQQGDGENSMMQGMGDMQGMMGMMSKMNKMMDECDKMMSSMKMDPATPEADAAQPDKG